MRTFRPDWFGGPFARNGLGYAVGLGLTGVFLLLQEHWHAMAFAGDTILEIYCIPILLAAYLGGLRSGLLTTAMAALGCLWFVIRDADTTGRPELEWSMLVALGVISSALAESLHRARRNAASYPVLEARLAQVAATVPGVLYSFQRFPDGRITFPYTNPAFEELMGLDSERAKHDATSTFERIHPDDLATVQAAITESERHLTPWRGEFRSRHPRRGEMWIEARSVPQRMPDGSTLWSGFASDVTDRKRSEQRLRDSEAELRALFASMNDVILVLDAEGRYLKIAPTNPANLYQPKQELEGRKVHEVLPRAEADGVLEQVKNALQLQRPQNYQYMLTIRGREVWFDATISPLSNTSVIWVARDITARRQTVRALEASDERLRRALESIPDVVVIYDAELRIQYINPATHRVTGRPASDFIGRRDEEIWPPEICQAYLPLLQEARRKRITRAAHVDLNLPATGTRHLRITCIPLLDDAGEVRELLGITHDYTEQWRTDRARRESEQRLRAIIDGAHSIVWMKDLDGRFLVVNEYTCSVLGLPGDQIVGRTVADLFPAAEAQIYNENDRQALATGQTMEFEESAQLADGPHVFLSVKIPLRDDHGRIYALAALCTDITWRKRAEQALQESEARFRSYVESAPVAVFVADREGRYVDCNPAATTLLGFDRESLCRKSIADMVAPEDQEAGQRHFQRVVAEGTSVGDLRLLRADGAIIWATVQAVRVSADRFMAYCIDITARRQAEETLRQQGAALEAAANAIVITDRDGVIQWVNPAFSLLTGYTAAEARGRKPGQLIRSGQQDASFYQAMWKTILAGHVWSGEIVNRRKDGSLFTEDMTITPLRDERGEITHFVAIKQDITQRKLLEAQLLRTQRLESVGRMASGIAHDLNNILTPVLLAPPILREGLQDKAALNIVDSIEASAERGAAIIRQLLTFGRGTTSHRVPLPVRTLMRDMMKIMEETFPKNIRIRLEVPPDLALVTADATQLHQVLMNLCVNARDAMPQGGQLTLSLQPAMVDEALARMHPGAHPGRHVVLSVADTGSGIPPEHLDKIFDPFFTTKAVGEGTGLGLSTVMAIVRGHEGILLVDSVPGQGTTFRVFLPISEVPPEPERPNHATPLPQGQGELVLVVDDESQIRTVIRRVLERNGYRSLEAENGAEAVAHFEEMKGQVRVVVTDLMMPVMDGSALIRALRERDRSLPIIVISGYLSQPELLTAVEADAQVFLSKPCNSAELLQALQKVIGRAR